MASAAPAALVLALLLGAALGVLAARNAHLPSSFPRCSLSDPKANECLRLAVQAVIPELVKGVPSLGVFPLDPLDILQADIGAPSGPVAISLSFKKLKIRGIHSTQLMSVSFDPKTYTINVRARLSAPLRLDGQYKIDGRVLVLPIQGEGQCNMRLDDIIADVNIVGHEHTKHGQKHMMVDKLQFSFETSKLTMGFQNLFNGNKELGDNMNYFLNENWAVVLGELKPSIHETFGATFQAIATRIFDKVPYNNIFLP